MSVQVHATSLEAATTPRWWAWPAGVRISHTADVSASSRLHTRNGLAFRFRRRCRRTCRGTNLALL